MSTVCCGVRSAAAKAAGAARRGVHHARPCSSGGSGVLLATAAASMSSSYGRPGAFFASAPSRWPRLDQTKRTTAPFMSGVKEGRRTGSARIWVAAP